MICRVAFHDETPDPITADTANKFRAWIKTMPGFVAGWHAQDPATGRAVSFTVWESEEHLLALRDQVPPGGPAGMKPTRMETFPVALPF
jgi:hypothetical protein